MDAINNGLLDSSLLSQHSTLRALRMGGKSVKSDVDDISPPWVRGGKLIHLRNCDQRSCWPIKRRGKQASSSQEQAVPRATGGVSAYPLTAGCWHQRAQV